MRLLTSRSGVRASLVACCWGNTLARRLANPRLARRQPHTLKVASSILARCICIAQPANIPEGDRAPSPSPNHTPTRPCPNTSGKRSSRVAPMHGGGPGVCRAACTWREASLGNGAESAPCALRCCLLRDRAPRGVCFCASSYRSRVVAPKPGYQLHHAEQQHCNVYSPGRVTCAGHVYACQWGYGATAARLASEQQVGSSRLSALILQKWEPGFAFV